MSKAKSKAAPLALIAPEVALPMAAAAEAQSAGQAVAKAMSTPIITRTKTERWDADAQEWVPDTRQTGVNVTPTAVGILGLLALGAGAVFQRGVRTGTVGFIDVYKVKITHADGRVEKGSFPDTTGTGRPQASYGPAGSTTEVISVSRRPKWRERDGIADYQPFARL